MNNRHHRFTSVVGVSLALIILASGIFLRGVNGSSSEAREKITLHASGRGNPWINLRDGHDLPTAYLGAANLEQSLEQHLARPRALAADDFDEDGMPDLVSSYADFSGGIVTIHRGNVDALFPNSPEAQQRKAAGAYTEAPFLPQARVFAAPEAPDFLGTGDFDGDGHWDVVAAARGSSALYLLPGDGRGALGQAQRIDLPGSVTALVTGEINRRDGLADIVAGIVTAEGPEVLVFESPEGALKGQPEVIGLPAEATALALGQLDDDYPMDLVAAASNELVIVHGRDRKLSLDNSSRADAPQASISQISFPFAITSIAIGDFTGSRRMEIALLSADGVVHLVKEDATPNTSQASERAITGRSESLAAGSWPQTTRLVCARVSGLPQNDLVVVDSANQQLHILVAAPMNDAATQGREDRGSSVTSLTSRVSVSLDVEGEPLAVLPMRLNLDALSDLIILKGRTGGLTVALTAPLATFTVNSTGGDRDCDPDDGVCSTGTKDQMGKCILTGQCTLLAAIEQANASPGADTIIFSVPSINGSSRRIVGPVTIDGTTQPAGQVELNGTTQPNRRAELIGGGLWINGGSSTIRGLVINRCDGTGIHLDSNGGNVVEGNYIGTDRTGTINLGNDVGISIDNTHNFIQGTTGNNTNNLIGGTMAAARNLISGNGVGINISAQIQAGNVTGNLVRGNYIGINATGTTPLGNSNYGVAISYGASGNTIGGTVAGARNIISGNGVVGSFSGGGVVIIGSGTGGNLVQGNYIGPNAAGDAIVGNIGYGVFISGGPANNMVGGTTATARNVISGNNLGNVAIGGDVTGNQVQGNFIGTNAAGNAALSNQSYGVFIDDALANAVGGAVSGAGNIIAFNRYVGVAVTQNNIATGNAIRRNSIFSNSGLGIDLVGGNEDSFGVTANDSGDGDSGANNLQNFPVLTSVTSTSTSITIRGTLNSKPSSSFTLEFFSNTACDPSGNGEGENFVGSTTVMTDSVGNVSFNVTFPTSVPSSRFITATATDNNGNTSEFSRCGTTGPGNSPPTINTVPVTRQQGSPPSRSTIANVSDLDQAANTLTVTVNGAASATINGVTVSGISINAAGVVTADVVASCTATNANFTLRVTDSGGLFNEATLTVTITANTPPMLSYNNASVSAGGSITVSPATASDNGSIIGYSVFNVTPPLNPPPTVNSSGKVSITNTPIGGTYNITVRATDNCGATTDATLMLTAQITGEVTGGLLYVLSDRTSGNQIYGYTVNETAGELTPLAGFPISTGGNGDGIPFFSERMTIDQANYRPYAVNEGSKTVSAYAINPMTGALTPLPFSPINVGMGNVFNLYFTIAVHPSGSPLVVGNGSNYQIASYQITETTATPALGSAYSTDFTSPFSVEFSQDGNYVYTGGFTNTFAGFSVNASTGVLTALTGSPFDSGNLLPLAYATDVAGRLFMVNRFEQMANRFVQVRVFTTANGIPSPVFGNPFTSGLTESAHGLLHPNGFYLVTDSVGNRVGVYRINGSESATTLAAVTGSPFASGGSFTNVLALNQAGTFLFAANGDSRNLTTFSVNPTTGALTSLGTQPVNALGATGRLAGMTYLSTGFEGDVAPRHKVNGSVTVSDWVLIGRFVARLDIPNPGSEFQRADCAPRTTLGDGAVTISDWVQAGRYAALYDPLTPAGGPTSPLSIALTAASMRAKPKVIASGPRSVRVIDNSLERGRHGAVTIELDAQGNENALGFSLNFDPEQLQFVSAAVGSGATGATLIVNTNQVASGRAGLVLAMPAGQVIAAGLRPIVIGTFDALSGGNALSSPISFGDQPIQREVSDPSANLLPTAFTSGTVTFTRAAPTLASLSPSFLAAGGAAFTITVTGANFTNSSVVRWSGSDRLTTFVSSTQLTAAIPASDIAAAGTASVTVFNLPPGGGLSNALTFTITPPRIEIIPPNPTANDEIAVRLSGVWPNTCIPLNPTLSVMGNEVQINTSNLGQFCGQAFTPWNLSVPIGRLAAGDYQVTAKHTSSTGQTELGRSSFTITSPPRPCIATVPPDRWRGEYYNHRELSGSPAMVRDDGNGFIDFNWGDGSPSVACGINTNNFSVRWTRNMNFGSGSYQFIVTGDDGVRLYIDGQLKLDKWLDQLATTYAVNIDLAAGNHTIVLEYYENGGLAVAKLSWSQITPVGAQATNRSTTTQCSEENNVDIDFAGRVVSFVIEATHPDYYVPPDSCAPDFHNCEPATLGFPFTPGVFKLFDDGETVFEAVREASWWRPNGMMAAVDNNAPVIDIHYIRIYRRIAGTSEYPQVLVLYMDGNLRLIPQPPAGASSVCFGSSVIVSPAAPAPRPIAEIASVIYFPGSTTVEIKYKDGGSANIILREVNRSLARVQVVINYPTDTLPFATFRSMYVADDNADVGRVKWLDIFGVVHDDPVLAFQGGRGTDWFFYRNTRSQHNTSAPDIRIKLESRP